MRKYGYIVIQEWMLDLGLKPSALIAYAIIFGFSQNGKGRFTGGADYIAEKLGESLCTAKRDLIELRRRGLIKKYANRTENGQWACAYAAVTEAQKDTRTEAQFAN